MQLQDSTLPSAPPEAKKPKSRKDLWVTLVMVSIVSGIVGVTLWWTTQPTFGYVQIRVVKGATSSLDIGGTTFFFSYNPPLSNAQTLHVVPAHCIDCGTDISPITQGSHYQVEGLEIVASEVRADYVVLLVKRLP